VGTVVGGKGWQPGKGPSAAYRNGLVDGRRDRAEGTPLSEYLKVGIDDYARGYRSGFFGHEDDEDRKGKMRHP